MASWLCRWIGYGCVCAIAGPGRAQMVGYYVSTTVQSVNPSAPGFPASLAGVTTGTPVTIAVRYDGSSPAAANPFAPPFSLATRYVLNSASFVCTIGTVTFTSQGGTPTAWVWNDDPITSSTLADGLLFTSLPLGGTQMQIGNMALPASMFTNEALPTTSLSGSFVLALAMTGSSTNWLTAAWSGLNLAPLASYTTFGAGCAGSLGVPTNGAIDLPRPGQTMRVRFGNLPQNVAVAVLGWSNTASTLGPLPRDLAPFGAPGCFARVSLDSTLVLVGAGGTADYTLTIPPRPVYLGAILYTQALVLAPGTNSLGAVISDAATAVVGV